MASVGPGSIVIGTAGHVDHGKSTLVEALTGIDPDRLAEEKARSMTIDLGFAWLTLPDGQLVSIVDVPGHERFIKNMLAGAGGIDAALLVIAADEGPMPQTAEHLAILDFLGIERGIVVLTKTDLVDADWLDLVTAEIEEQLRDSPLRQAALVPVSARTGAGLDRLRHEIGLLADRIPPRASGDRPRLPIDRVFTVAGFGTVVTGTLHGGGLSLGQELRLFPGERLVRVRGLQTHGQAVAAASPGSRVAVNLAGAAVEQVRRGDVLAPPSLLTPSHRLDVHVRLLPGIDWELRQNSEVDVFTGASELPARITLLDRESLAPGDAGWVQLRLHQPVAVLPGDRFVLRRPSPSTTVGGGTIVNPTPPRHKRFQPGVILALETVATGSPAEVLLAAIAARPLPVPGDPTAPVAGLSPVQISTALAELTGSGQVTIIESSVAPRPGGFAITVAQAEAWQGAVLDAVSSYHRRYPLRRGIPMQAARDHLPLAPDVGDAVIASVVGAGLIENEQWFLRLPAFTISFTPEQQARIERFQVALAEHPFAPPPPAAYDLDDETVAALEHMGQAVRISPDILVSPSARDELVRVTLGIIEAAGAVSLAQIRDELGTTRKYAQAMLEHLDRQRVTRRLGDVRIRHGQAVAGPEPPGATKGLNA